MSIRIHPPEVDLGEHEVYDLPGSGWDAVTNVPCPVRGCQQTIVWYEAENVPGYRVCMMALDVGRYDMSTIRHRFLASVMAGLEEGPDGRLVRDECCEQG